MACTDTGNPMHSCYRPAGGGAAGAAAAQTASEPRLLVLLRDASALAVVDPAEGTVLGQVPTVGNPHEVAATPDGRLAFVASPSEGISVIDLESMTEVRRLDVGAGSVPHDVRFVDGKLYFTIEGFKSIARYDPQADEVDWSPGPGTGRRPHDDRQPRPGPRSSRPTASRTPCRSWRARRRDRPTGR